MMPCSWNTTRQSIEQDLLTEPRPLSTRSVVFETEKSLGWSAAGFSGSGALFIRQGWHPIVQRIRPPPFDCCRVDRAADLLNNKSNIPPHRAGPAALI